MNKLILTIMIIFAITIANEAPAQDLNKIGAVGIEFLLNSNDGQKSLNSDEQLALYLLGNFLNEKSNREHEMNIANASSTKIIQTQTGSQVLLVKDTEGNIYLMQNGILHKISSTAINLVKENPGSQHKLPAYNLGTLEQKYNSAGYGNRTEYYTTPKEGTTVSSILSLFPNAIKINAIRSNPNQNNLIWDKRYSKEKVLTKKLRGGKRTYVTEEYFDFKLKTTFTCTWNNDDEGDGLGFNDFENISRVFHKSDDYIYFIINYCNYTKEDGTIKFRIYNFQGFEYTLELKSDKIEGNQIYAPKISPKSLKPGIYYYDIDLIGNPTGTSHLTERFQIIE